jgi:hypothetical protein
MKLKNPFSTPTALELATRELAEAQRQLLSAQTAMEYARSMVDYNAQRIERLEAYVRSQTK